MDLLKWLQQHFRPRLTTGQRGENEAARYLKHRGFKILHRNYKNTFGEIDLIAKDGSQLVFIEVRTRSAEKQGHPAETIGPVKQRKISRTALGYLKYHNTAGLSARFDVVTILWGENAKVNKIDYFPNAFPVTE